MPESAPVLVLVVNFRTPTEAIRCLESLEAERSQVPGLQVCVVDNGSGDDSAEQLEKVREARGWQEWLTIRAHPENLGFGGGNNLVLRDGLEQGSLPPFVLLLNPDTAVVPGALRRLLAFAEAHPRAGFVGPATSSAPPEAPFEADVTAFRFPGLISHAVEGLRLGFVARLLRRWQVAPPPPAEAWRFDWVSGGAMLIRREVLEQVGLFDESFFLYFEETDLCRRAKRAGFEAWYCPEAQVYHWAGASTGLGRREGPPARIPAYWHASRQRYFRKRYGVILTWLADLVFVLGRLLWMLLAKLTGRRRQDPEGFLRDFVAWNLCGRRWQGTRSHPTEGGQPGPRRDPGS